MKRVYALLLSVLLIVMLAACAPAGSDAQGADTQPQEEATEAPVLTVKDDASVFALQFTPPASYEKVRRFIEEDASGKIVEKNLVYTFADESELSYAYMINVTIGDYLDLDTMESKEVDGGTFYYRDDSGDAQAFLQMGEDVYGIQYAKCPDMETFEALLDSITFSDSADTLGHDRDLFDINYTIDDSLPLWGYTSNITETPAGELIQKEVTWLFGKEMDDLDFRFMIRVYKNKTIEELKKEDKLYEEATVNDIAYTVLASEDDDPPYEYYTQHGDDVYEIRNSGSNTGWYTVRSDESYTAFDAFLNTISFK